MSDKLVTYATDNAIATITIDNPPMNPLTTGLREQLLVILDELIASKRPLAVRAAKEAINRGLNMTLSEGLEVEAYHWSYLCGTEDQKEGARAFIEKRKPVFKGS